ncbi:MAG: TetR/AcrR family transcriptional regulator [Acidimicrobiales bacterium]
MPSTTKRERLISAATDLSLRVGFDNASIATIAEHADVPVGNVYYYFKTKDDLAAAVVAGRREEYAQLRRSWDAADDPADRLVAFVRHTLDSADALADHGCPIGGLCADLSPARPELGAAAGEIFADTIRWATETFAATAHPRPHEAGARLVALLQGATVLAHALGDPQILRDECGRCEGDVRSLGTETDHPETRA